MTPGKIKARLIKGDPPNHKFFIPSEKCDSNTKEVIITIAEWEALRLCDLENYKQRDAAKAMGLSQPTINRLLARSHYKIMDALKNGYAVKFEDESLIICPYCQHHLSAKNQKSVDCPNCGKLVELD